MVNVTVAVSEELKKKMDEHDTANWSAVARRAFEQKIQDLEFLKEFRANSTMTEKDAIRLGRQLNKSAMERLQKSGKFPTKKRDQSPNNKRASNYSS